VDHVSDRAGQELDVGIRGERRYYDEDLPVDALETVINHIHEIIAGLPRKERKELKDLVKEIHRKEWEADQIEMRMAKKLYSLDLDPLTIIHLSKTFDLIDQIANHTENAGDWVRAMMAR